MKLLDLTRLNYFDSLPDMSKPHLGISRIDASAAGIEKAVNRVFIKKTGKQRGYDAIEDNIRATIEKEFQKHGSINKVFDRKIDAYVEQRLRYMHNAFKGLNAPKRDISDERAERIGNNENFNAKQFGRTLGWQASGKQIQKEWVCNGDCCELCMDNADDGPIDVDDVFSDGSYSAGAHPACDCDVVYTSEDDDLSAQLREEDEGYWIGFDFDNTIAREVKPFDPKKTGKPIPKMLNKLKGYLKRGENVKIFTARAADPVSVKAVRKWLIENVGRELPITNVKDHLCRRLYDDKAVNPRDVEAFGTSEGVIKEWEERARNPYDRKELVKQYHSAAKMVMRWKEFAEGKNIQAPGKVMRARDVMRKLEHLVPEEERVSRLDAYGTSEGALKGWEHRQRRVLREGLTPIQKEALENVTKQLKLKRSEKKVADWVLRNQERIKDVRHMTGEEMQGLAHELGFPKDRVDVAYGEKKFNVGGIEWTEGGHYSFADKRITLYPDNLFPGRERGIVAHEVEHAKYDAVFNAWKQETAKMNEAYVNRTEDNQRPNGMLRDEYKSKYPINAEFQKLDSKMAGDFINKLIDKDGVSDYSKSYWNEFRNQNGNMAYAQRAIHETLAEISSKKANTGHRSGVAPIWKAFHSTVDRIFRNQVGGFK